MKFKFELAFNWDNGSVVQLWTENSGTNTVKPLLLRENLQFILNHVLYILTSKWGCPPHLLIEKCYFGILTLVYTTVLRLIHPFIITSFFPLFPSILGPKVAKIAKQHIWTSRCRVQPATTVRWSKYTKIRKKVLFRKIPCQILRTSLHLKVNIE